MAVSRDREMLRLQTELSRMAEQAEFHAFGVRQVTAQRARLFKLLQTFAAVALFDDGSPIADVVQTIVETGSQFYQDVFPLLLSRGKRGGYFVEFGACDGLLISNTFLLERKFGWQGILSEPSRAWHEALKRNRRCILDFRCVHAETGKTVEFAEYDDDEYGTQSAVRGDGTLQSVKASYDVQTVTLRDLLREYNAPRFIDLISIDIEGGEYDVLKNFPFDEYEFGFACVEQMTEAQAAPIRALFDRAGYVQVLRDVSGHDGYYVRKDRESFSILSALDQEEVPGLTQDVEFWKEWYDGTTFTTDWSTRAFSTWDRHLRALKDEELKILEVGAWEGRGSIFFLNYFPGSKLTCVDIFTLGNEPLFDRNVGAKYGSRVRKIASTSTRALEELRSRNQQFDLIYLDGSHNTDDVMMDSLLAWPILKEEGILIWDDYQLLSAMPGSFASHQDPKPAIDTFLEWKAGQFELFEQGYQVIVRKLKAPHVDGDE